MYVDKEKVLMFLPHRDPFLFIDTVESIKKNDMPLEIGSIETNQDTLGIEINANFYTRPDLEIFKGHFPGNPILPGVVQVEMMAQASIFTIICRDKDPYNLNLEVAFMGANDAKFRKPIFPDMHLKIKCICMKCRGKFTSPMMSFDCEIYHEDTKMSEVTVLAAIKY